MYLSFFSADPGLGNTFLEEVFFSLFSLAELTLLSLGLTLEDCTSKDFSRLPTEGLPEADLTLLRGLDSAISQ